MRKLVDKIVVVSCCMALFVASMQFDAASLAGLIAAIAATFAFSYIDLGNLRNRNPEHPSSRHWNTAIPIIMIAASAVAPGYFALAAPMAAYDLASCKPRWLAFLAVVPVLAAISAIAAQSSPAAEATSWASIEWASGISPYLAIVSYSILIAVSTLLGIRTQSLQTSSVKSAELRVQLEDKVFSLKESNQNLEEAREYAEQEATMAERARISRDIHDNVGHMLTRSILQIEALKLVRPNDEQLENELDIISDNLKEALDSTRKSVHDLSDQSVDLQTQIHKLAENSVIDSVEVQYDVENRVPANVSRCMIAIARESLTNAAKHGHATQASIRISEFPALWQIAVTNNGDLPGDNIAGAGSAVNPSSSRGMGVRSMEERVKALGGTFRISCDKAYRVFASIPKEGTK